MEYLLILVLAVLLVVLILAFRPTHRASAMRQAIFYSNIEGSGGNKIF